MRGSAAQSFFVIRSKVRRLFYKSLCNGLWGCHTAAKCSRDVKGGGHG